MVNNLVQISKENNAYRPPSSKLGIFRINYLGINLGKLEKY